MYIKLYIYNQKKNYYLLQIIIAIFLFYILLLGQKKNYFVLLFCFNYTILMNIPIIFNVLVGIIRNNYHF